MNDRIDQLIEQCTTQQFSDCVGGYETFDKEKFAELIVRECSDIAYKEADHLEDEFERGRADDLRRWANVMKKHFGVEE